MQYAPSVSQSENHQAIDPTLLLAGSEAQASQCS
jgi:hypothetical protein